MTGINQINFCTSLDVFSFKGSLCELTIRRRGLKRNNPLHLIKISRVPFSNKEEEVVVNLSEIMSEQLAIDFDSTVRFIIPILEEERALNGGSKVSVSLNNFKTLHSDYAELLDYEDSDEESICSDDGHLFKTEHIPRCGRRVLESFPPGIATGEDVRVSNAVYNEMKQFTVKEGRKRASKVKDKEDKSTEGQHTDPKTRLILYKNDDYRFRDRFSKQNPRKVVHLWAEKEKHNLSRMIRKGVNVPEVFSLKKHVLVMSFIGSDGRPAPKLKEAVLSSSDWKGCYSETVSTMKTLYHDCHLVHSDLSEYNILWHEKRPVFIDVSQAVEPTHPHALEFLYRDIVNITDFFSCRIPPKDDLVKSYEDLFFYITNLSLDPEHDITHQLIKYQESNENNHECFNSQLNNSQRSSTSKSPGKSSYGSEKSLPSMTETELKAFKDSVINSPSSPPLTTSKSYIALKYNLLETNRRSQRSRATKSLAAVEDFEKKTPLGLLMKVVFLIQTTAFLESRRGHQCQEEKGEHDEAQNIIPLRTEGTSLDYLLRFKTWA
ncbi:RIOK3 [Lepeophtheirus salmonis]|uniref:non-specific serine/threonine protein kinase n=1 Tax=Lepeophtheirus salmonis TaxID=72036 RepID=A0A7R8CQH5_LEPSM|nr:RIOK3 [Lepeophtheirus salmonis]CAF2893336.1 RIOK3 [Lepeophtheirus salmonis]